eukprot:125305-Prymnesium_polylepis.1
MAKVRPSFLKELYTIAEMRCDENPPEASSQKPSKSLVAPQNLVLGARNVSCGALVTAALLCAKRKIGQKTKWFVCRRRNAGPK